MSPEDGRAAAVALYTKDFYLQSRLRLFCHYYFENVLRELEEDKPSKDDTDLNIKQFYYKNALLERC